MGFDKFLRLLSHCEVTHNSSATLKCPVFLLPIFPFCPMSSWPALILSFTAVFLSLSATEPHGTH